VHVCEVKTSKDYALKILQYEADPIYFDERQTAIDKATKGQEEASIATKFSSSPYICPIHKCTVNLAEEESYVYLLMDLYPKGGLGTEIKRQKKLDKPFEEQRIVKWLKCIASGLTDVHAGNVIHRNIKPPNLLLDGDNLRISDFGIATLQTHATHMSGKGTLAYMAPEQFEKIYTEKGDIWAAGAVLYELLTLKTPEFYSSTPEQRIQDNVKGYSMGLIKILRLMLSVDVKDRPTASDIVEMLKPMT